MELSEYREEFLSSLRSDAKLYGNPHEIQFVESALELLEKNEEIIDPIHCFCNYKGSRNRNIGFHAYSYSEADSSIILVITDFEDSTETSNLTNEDIVDLSNKMRYFIEDAYNENIKCDISDSILDIAKEFREKIGYAENTEITSFRFYIVTNKTLSNRVKSVESQDLLNRPVSIQIWTLERFFDNYKSSLSERINIKCKDWGIEGIQCIKANVASSNIFDSYMGIVPGLLLAKLFKKYQAPLLEGNIRCFLSAKGKINKSIKATIVGEHPENFFTYNNGIAVVSNSVKLSDDGHYITEFDGFQIINGGQTTASLTNALIKGEAPAGNMEKIFVPMKLTVLNFNLDDFETVEEQQKKQDLYNTIVKDISKSSNWQNPTKEADFFSNDPFHREMEKLSMEITTPILPGQISGTYWFYERSKNRWDQSTFYMTKAKRNAWIALHPKKQVITKEKLGQYYNTVDMLPHYVCKGAVANMPIFARTIMDIMATKKDIINSFFFKKYVAAKILFDETDRIIDNAPWYNKGGYKAMYVPYTISKIIATLPEGKEIDWKRIWGNQSVYESLVRQIEIVAKKTMEFLKAESHGGIERSFAVKEETWKKYRNEPLNLEDDFLQDLADSNEFKLEEKSAAKVVRFNDQVDLFAKVHTLGGEYWLEVYEDLERQKLLSPGERGIIKSMGEYLQRGYFLSDAQVKKLWKVVQKIENETDYILK
ncbi:MAG: AIPR family protein [Bacteroidales bacterium]|nr:AIPR family protein [Bacteroidales bacterium]